MSSRTRHALKIKQLAEMFLDGYAPVDAQSRDRYRTHARSILGVHVVPALGQRRASWVTAGEIERMPRSPPRAS